MIKVRLSGGIGNQLFQLFFALYVKKIFEVDVQLDSNRYRFEKLRKVEIDLFNTGIDITTDDGLFSNYQGLVYRMKLLLFKVNYKNEYFRDDRFLFPSKLGNRNHYFDGYWQSDFYVSNIDNFRTILRPISKIPASILPYLSLLEAKNTVALHIRRGDFFSSEFVNRYGVCSLRYYDRAIEYAINNISNPLFFVFSDDIEWVRVNLKTLPMNTIFVINEQINSYWYIHLMSKANHNIISNSTYSWWGAFLNENNDKIVISPNKWMVNSKFTLSLNEWIKLPVD